MTLSTSNPRAHRLGRASLGVAVGLWLAAAALAQSGTGTVRVSTSGSDFSSCGAAASPCRTVDYAINRAASNLDVVKVETGTYTDSNSCVGDTAVLCMANQHGIVQGGFSGGDWTNPDPENTPTVIDGQGLRRVVRIQDGGSAAPDTASLTLEGVTLTNGFFEGAASGTDTDITAFGGCIDAINAPLFFTDVIISDCHVLGGGSVSSSPDDHGGAGAGGGIALRGFPDNVQTSVFHRVTFEGNVAEGGSRSQAGIVRGGFAQGGGIFIFRARLEATDLVFVDNVSDAGDALSGSGTSGGGTTADAQGAGLNVNVGGEAIVDGVVATGNRCLGGDASNSTGTGGGAFGAGLYSEQGSLTVTDLDVRQNESIGGDAASGGLGTGGGFMGTASVVDMDRGSIIDNLSRGGSGSTAGSAGGGGVYLTSSNGYSFSNLIVADNATELGTGSGGAGGGGGFFLQAADGELVHLTVAGNRLNSTRQQGEAIVLLGGSDVDLDYSIVSDHSGTGSGRAIHVQSVDSMTFASGLFAGNAQNTNQGEAGSGTFNSLGSMSDVASIEYVSPGSPDLDYRILSTSPAIDAAAGSSEALDFEGQSRDAPDIGADELGGLPIFADGFETGNTSRWTITSP